jgi:hypothetical protein
MLVGLVSLSLFVFGLVDLSDVLLDLTLVEGVLD